jgi:hypothetical protein
VLAGRRLGVAGGGPLQGTQTNPPTMEVAETGGAATVPFGWSDTATALPVGHRYPWRSAAAISQSDDGWMGPLTLR